MGTTARFVGFIRPVSAGDGGALPGLIEPWVGHDTAREIFERVLGPEQHVVAVDPLAGVVGVMGLEVEGIDPPLFGADDRPCGLISAYVHPDHRGRGVGTALADHLEARARADGRTQLVVVSGARSRTVGYPFWRARYGSPASFEPDRFGPGVERIAWSVPLVTGRARVRPAVLADAQDIASTRVRSWQAAYVGLIAQSHLDGLDPTDARGFTRNLAQADPPFHILVAEVDGTHIGFALVAAVRSGPGVGELLGDAPPPPPEGAGEVCAIYLEPAAWGRGHGAVLLRAAEAALAERGHRVATLWVLTGNDPRQASLRTSRVGARRGDEAGAARRRGGPRGPLREGDLT